MYAGRFLQKLLSYCPTVHRAARRNRGTDGTDVFLDLYAYVRIYVRVTHFSISICSSVPSVHSVHMQ